MPELPEVQTVVNSLKPNLPGKIIQSVKCPNGYTGVFENGSLQKYNNFLIGQKLQSVYRCPAPTNWTSLRVSIVS